MANIMGKVDATVDKARATDVAAMLAETMRPMLREDPASTIAGFMSFLAATANGMTNGDHAGSAELLHAWMGTAVAMSRRLHAERPVIDGEAFKFGEGAD